MKTKLGLVLFLCGNLWALSTLATGGGSEAGNGGSSIVCQDASKNITSVELLDFYEARTQRNIKVDLGPVTDSVQTKLALAVQRLERLDHGLGSLLWNEMQKFESESHFYSGIRLVEIPDSQNLFIPQGCQQEQIAIWRTPTVPEDSQYNINQDLWDRLDNDNKAGLILHETLYFIASQNLGSQPMSDSRMVRYLVSKISSAAADTWELKDYVDVLRQLHFKTVTYKNFTYAITDATPYFMASGDFMGGPLSMSQPIQLQGKPVFVSEILFDGNGNFFEVTLLDTTLLSVGGQDIWFQSGRPLYVDHDHVTSGFAVASSKNVFQKPGAYDLKIKSSGGLPVQLQFALDGTLQMCRACEGTVFVQGNAFPVVVPTPFEENSIYDSISYAILDGGDTFTVFLSGPTNIQEGSQTVVIEGQAMGKLSTGLIFEAKLAQKTDFEVGSKTVSFDPGRVAFDKSGKIRVGTLAEDTVLTSLDGKDATYWAGMSIHLTENGLVSEVLSLKRSKSKPSNRGKK